MRIGFVTAVKLGLDCIEEISRLGGKLDLLITLSDNTATKKVGRMHLDNFASETGVFLHKTDYINDSRTVKVIEEAELDYLLVIGWSQLIGDEIFKSVKHSIIGMHPTILPRGRGRAPIPWTIIKDIKVSGVSMFELSREADTGPIFSVDKFFIAPDENANTLYEKVRTSHKKLIRENWPLLVSGNLVGQPQNEEIATYWDKRKPSDGEITTKMNVYEIDRLVRALTHPYPGAFFIENRRKLMLWSGFITNVENKKFASNYLCRGDLCYEPVEYDWIDNF